MEIILLPGMDGAGTLFAPFRACLPASLPTRVISYADRGDSSYEALHAMATAGTISAMPTPSTQCHRLSMRFPGIARQYARITMACVVLQADVIHTLTIACEPGAAIGTTGRIGAGGHQLHQ